MANRLGDDVHGYRVDESSGALTPVAGAPWDVGVEPVDLAADPLGRYLFVANSQSDSVSVFLVDRASGVLTSAGAGLPQGVAVDAQGRFLYVSNFLSDTVSGFSIGAGGTLTALPGYG